MQSELKPCPFCGGPAHSTPSVKSANFAAVIMCTENDCASVFGADLEIATQTWNRRAITAALSDKQAVEVKDEDAWLGLSTVSNEDLQEALDHLPSVLRPSMSNRIVAAITEQASIIDRFKRTSRARRLSFEAARSALVDVPAVGPVGEAVVSTRLPGFTLATFEESEVPAGTKLYTSPPLSREGEDRAEVERLTRPIVGIEHRTAQEVFDIMANRIRLAATRSGSATGHSGGDHAER